MTTSREEVEAVLVDVLDSISLRDLSRESMQLLIDDEPLSPEDVVLARMAIRLDTALNGAGIVIVDGLNRCGESMLIVAETLARYEQIKTIMGRIQLTLSRLVDERIENCANAIEDIQVKIEAYPVKVKRRMPVSPAMMRARAREESNRSRARARGQR